MCYENKTGRSLASVAVNPAVPATTALKVRAIEFFLTVFIMFALSEIVDSISRPKRLNIYFAKRLKILAVITKLWFTSSYSPSAAFLLFVDN